MKSIVAKEEFKIPGTNVVIEAGDKIVKVEEGMSDIDPAIFDAFVSNIEAWMSKNYKIPASQVKSHTQNLYSEINAPLPINKNSWEGLFSMVSLEVHAMTSPNSLYATINMNFTPIGKDLNRQTTGMVVAYLDGDPVTGKLL